MANPHHGSDAFHRGMNAPHSRYFASGKFGRLFPTLPPLFHRDKTEEQLRTALLDLGAPGGPMTPSGSNPDNPAIALGFGFFGQFVDHDITLDTTSSFERQNDPEGITNFRTPALELDSVYGSGPSVDPWLYADGVRLLTESEFGRDQIPRAPVSRVALIGDPRNDENLVISQLHLAFLKAHNGIVDALQAGGVDPAHRFSEAQRILRWHYQWTVLHEFLPLTVGQDLVDDVYNVCEGGGRRFYSWRHEPFIPVEFSVAAYRFGHTQIPARFKVNDEFVANGNERIVLFDRDEVGDSDPDDLSGFGLRAQRRYVDWANLFETPGGSPQATKQLDTILSKPLFDLPFVPAGNPDDPASLAARNLLRGHVFGLPSGQDVACAMCIEPLSAGDLGDVAGTGFDTATPLWFYILKEAEVVGGGSRLGPVGGRIVAEVLIGLLEGDRMSFVRANPKWKPEDEGLGSASGDGILNLLRFAGFV